MKVLNFLFLILFLGGCASFGEIRNSEPVKATFIADQTPKKIANCVLYELKNEDGLAPILAEKNNSFFIMVSGAPDFGKSYNFGELSFKPLDNGTKIELRMNYFFNAQTAYLWDKIVNCSSYLNNPGAIVGVKQ